uniref:Peptide transporter PTR2 n=2 Tax=Cajanus cajan TaxID=3821 RepID=A0A151U9K0_CAJCA|nr:Peptide transporter PTR2 [Cajanus cajan]
MEQETEKRKEGKSEENEEKWVHDASVDYKGRLPLRASTGVWKASLFILTIEFSERVCHFGLSSNLITYLTKVMHKDLNTATKNVNYWVGATTLMPLIGGFVADAYTGRYRMIIYSSLVYLKGLSMLTMSQFMPILKPCNNEICDRPRKFHEVVFFFALYCIALGTGGFKPCLESFGADQFDGDHLEERKQKMSFFNWWTFALCVAMLLGTTVVVYVQDVVGWGIACLMLTIFMVFNIIAFYVGKPFYRYRRPQGNPFIPILQVLIAATRKRNLSCPSNHALLYEVPKSEKHQGRLLSHTSRLRFLDKAAIVEGNYTEEKDNPWRLTTVTRVEETKLILNVVPVWLTSLMIGVCIAQSFTLFVKQAAAMNLEIINNFKIPPASMASVTAISSIISVPIYDKIIVPILRKVTGNERGISIFRRIGIGLTFLVLAMVVAALVETKRLKTVEHQVLTVGGTRHETMSVLWLIPQNLILGLGADSLSLIGLQEYFYDQVPDSMRSLGMALYLSVLGAGFFLSSFLIIIVDHVTGKNGRSWIAKDINSSRLDKFYWMLVVVNALNLCLFIFLAKRYTYKTVHRKASEIDGCNSDAVEIVA